MSDASGFVTPAELGRELGHDDRARPGRKVRDYLRDRYPDRLKNQQWQLTPEEADDVRRHFESLPRSNPGSLEADARDTGRTKRISSAAPSSDSLFNEALIALRGPRWAIADAASRVPNAPGLYAIYGDESAWRDLELAPAPDVPLYIGKAEDSLVSRDLNAHFAIQPGSTAQTGHSTVRRSLAALLRGPLELRAIPRNLTHPGHFSNYGLANDGDARLTEWMHHRLTLAIWSLPATEGIHLADVERRVIATFTPRLNLSQNPGKLERLRRARADMAADAARWRPES